MSHLHWRGSHYKDMEIKIDVVPAIPFADHKPASNYVEDPCFYYIFDKEMKVVFGTRLYKVAYSDVELTLIKKLPRNECQGLKIAKGVRISRLFPTAIQNKLRGVHAIDDYLKTYMLKMALLVIGWSWHLTETDIHHEGLSPLAWAYMIYCHIRERLITNGELPILFQDITEEGIFKCTDPLDTPLPKRRACCVKRLNLILISSYLAALIKRQLQTCTIPALIQLLERMASEAAKLRPEGFESLANQGHPM